MKDLGQNHDLYTSKTLTKAGRNLGFELNPKEAELRYRQGMNESSNIPDQPTNFLAWGCN